MNEFNFPQAESTKELPIEVTDFYKEIGNGSITNVSAADITFKGSRYGIRQGGLSTSDPILLESDTSIYYVPEFSIEQRPLKTGEVAISLRFYECNGIIWKKGNELFFVHNTNNTACPELKVNLIFQLGLASPPPDWTKLGDLVENGEPEKSLLQDTFDEVLIIGKDPKNLSEYFASSAKKVSTIKVPRNPNNPNASFDVWVKNNGGEIEAGVI